MKNDPKQRKKYAGDSVLARPGCDLLNVPPVVERCRLFANRFHEPNFFEAIYTKKCNFYTNPWEAVAK